MGSTGDRLRTSQNPGGLGGNGEDEVNFQGLGEVGTQCLGFRGLERDEGNEKQQARWPHEPSRADAHKLSQAAEKLDWRSWSLSQAHLVADFSTALIS